MYLVGRIHHEHQFRPADAAITAGQRWCEGALLQALVVKHKAAVLPVQQLDEATGAV